MRSKFWKGLIESGIHLEKANIKKRPKSKSDRNLETFKLNSVRNLKVAEISKPLKFTKDRRKIGMNLEKAYQKAAEIQEWQKLESDRNPKVNEIKSALKFQMT